MSFQTFKESYKAKEASSSGGTATSAFASFKTNHNQGLVNQNVQVQTTTPYKLPTPKITPIKEEDTGIKERLKTSWNWLSKQLNKAVGAVAIETEQLGKWIGTGEKYTPLSAGVDVLRGNKEASFTEIWGHHGVEMGLDPRVAGAIGLVIDLTADPLNYVGGGLTNKGKTVQKAASLLDAGQDIKKGSKLAKQIAKLGLKGDDLVMGANKAEQVVKGQRAFLKVGTGTRIEKTLVKGEKIFKGTAKVSKAAKATKGAEAIRTVFSKKTGFPVYDDLMRNYENLSNYRKGQVLETAVDLQKELKVMQPADLKRVASVLESPMVRETMTDKKILETADKLEDLFSKMKRTEKGAGVLKTELQSYFPHIKTKPKLLDRINYFFNPKKYNQALAYSKTREIAGTVEEINRMFGTEFFQTNPVISYATRGLASAKSVTAKEFLTDVGKKFFVNAEDAPIRFTESNNPLFKGLKAEPEIVKSIDKYITGIQPQELKTLIKSYDVALNWWKGQVLLSPSYHIRNIAGNFWNNWLAGVKNPISYIKGRSLQAGKNMDEVLMLTDAGKRLTKADVLDLAKLEGIVGTGQYGADIEKLFGQPTKVSKLKLLNPLDQENALLKTNRAVGSALEDNARLAHFIEKLQEGYSAKDAGLSVKKYLFDYSDISDVERNIIKRVLPFYTWSRKNLPLQLENLITQPSKISLVPKVINAIEQGVEEPETDKYISDWITSNVPVRTRKNEEGNFEYFLLGNWLPSASAIDLLSNPIDNLIGMTTPAIKTPLELWSNKSTFFKNTLGEPSEIEFYHQQPTTFVGVPMRKKTAHLLRNIRILGDLDKLVKKPMADEAEHTATVKLLNVLFGKAATYDIEQAKGYYDRDTQRRIGELETAIARARKIGENKHAEELILELQEFVRLRAEL